MGEEDQFSTRTKFFKIMLPDFNERLRLPPAFCEKVKHEKSKRAILESCKGKWEINVCREDDDQIVLQDGWPQFADEHELSLRDFLVFEHTGKLHFNVFVCDSTTGRQKQFVVEPDNNEHQTINPINRAKEMASLRSQRPCFTHKMTRFTASKRGSMHIPLEFAKSNNLEQQESAILKDARGREWRVNVYVTRSAGFSMNMMGSGWHDFVAANNFKQGDVCTFELQPLESPTSKIISFHVRIN